MERDKKVIAESVRQQLPIVITTYTLPRNMETYVREVLRIFLEECHQDHMYEYLNFCLGELLTNAKKANTKRVYFKYKNLDINNLDDYKKGMENFKEETLSNIDHFLELQKKAGLYIKLVFHFKGDKVKIEIRNNSVLTPIEKERIQNKLDSVQQYTSMEDAFHRILDQSEGAGLGIIIMILMLQKIGLSKDNYQVMVDGNETVTRIVLPCNEKIFGGTDMLCYQFVRLQDSIPCLKDSFAKVQKFGISKKMSRSDLYDMVSKDTMLTMLLLKRAFAKGCKELDLIKVFECLSDEELSEIYSLDNPDVSIVRSNKTARPYFVHAQNVAEFAYNIAKNYDIAKIFTPSEMYTIGLLNSFGILILKTASDEQKEYVEDLLEGYDDLADKVRGVFYSGIEAPYLGMVYTKKEGFPDTVDSVIGFWNDMDEVKNKELLPAHKIIYLAESLQSFNEGNLEFYQLDKEILSTFNITSEGQFKGLLNMLTKA